MQQLGGDLQPTHGHTRGGEIAVEDFDNDGLDDLYEATGRVRWQADNWSDSDWLAEPNLLFTQLKPGRFSLVDSEGGVSSPLVKSAHGVSAGDIDGDGGVDLIVVNKDATVDVLKNVVQNRGNWVVLDVRNKHGFTSDWRGCKSDINRWNSCNEACPLWTWDMRLQATLGYILV